VRGVREPARELELVVTRHCHVERVRAPANTVDCLRSCHRRRTEIRGGLRRDGRRDRKHGRAEHDGDVAGAHHWFAGSCGLACSARTRARMSGVTHVKSLGVASRHTKPVAQVFGPNGPGTHRRGARAFSAATRRRLLDVTQTPSSGSARFGARGEGQEATIGPARISPPVRVLDPTRRATSQGVNVRCLVVMNPSSLSSRNDRSC
jgi:hypothetical protein